MAQRQSEHRRIPPNLSQAMYCLVPTHLFVHKTSPEHNLWNLLAGLGQNPLPSPTPDNALDWDGWDTCNSQCSSTDGTWNDIQPGASEGREGKGTCLYSEAIIPKSRMKNSRKNLQKKADFQTFLHDEVTNNFSTRCGSLDAMKRPWHFPLISGYM